MKHHYVLQYIKLKYDGGNGREGWVKSRHFGDLDYQHDQFPYPLHGNVLWPIRGAFGEECLPANPRTCPASWIEFSVRRERVYDPLDLRRGGQSGHHQNGTQSRPPLRLSRPSPTAKPPSAPIVSTRRKNGSSSGVGGRPGSLREPVTFHIYLNITRGLIAGLPWRGNSLDPASWPRPKVDIYFRGERQDHPWWLS